MATTNRPSGTARQPGSSSRGSEASSTDSGVRRTDSACPATLATTVTPSVSSRFNRDPGAAAATAATVPATAAAGSSPARSRCRTSAQSSAASVGASSVSRSRTGSPAASGTTVSGQPRTTPLWLNNQRPSANGAAAVSCTGMPTVADRTAASTAPATVTAASSGRVVSLHSGRARR
ncbi:hypothetical protein GA0070621_1513 [Micromonospora narathiwatensis]|uniref:Uncharacterized protein n=1 Tax=Micromonospora narathiwatensis TaxID=299146 RepID=A0A1A8ZEZ9_9ACTN|nr:hypothetical protein GA0070621_1513 [Micromonospora narathiwatensis]